MSIESSDILDRVKQVIVRYAELGDNANHLNPDDDLFAQGMSSRASVGVMLGLESEFDIEFPDSMLRKDVFMTIRAISTAIETIISSH
jgi:acyl carrier protein